MSDITPILPSSVTPYYGPGENQNLIQKLEELYKEYNQELGVWQHEHPPTEKTQEALVEIAIKVRDFLIQNKTQLMAIAKQEGWANKGTDSFTNFYEGTIQGVNSLLDALRMHPPPELDGVLIFINEQICNAAWFLTHRTPPPHPP